MGQGRHAVSAVVRTRTGRRRAAAALGPLMALALVLSTVVVALGARADRADAATATPELPFDSVRTSSSRLVLAHYVPWFPVSFDNKDEALDTYATRYLDPLGENGKHAAYGGYLRDRPAPVPVSTSSDWADALARAEVRRALAAGIDGFAVDLVSLNRAGRSWGQVVRLLDAARAVDPSFRIVLQPDMVGLASVDAASLAAAVAELAARPAAMRMADGSLVVSPYFAEKRSVAWWSSWKSTMSRDYGLDVSLVPVLQDDLTWADDFAPISAGIGNWGSRNPAWNPPTTTTATSPRGRIARVHALGRFWMQPVSFQDQRPSGAVFDEAANSQNLRSTWQIAREGGAEWVLLTTWNDYAEGSAFAPSSMHGEALLDLTAYYAAWFKSGSAPTVVRDAVYLTHRVQPAAALPSYPETSLMTLRGGTPVQDRAEALVLLTAPATVRVVAGGRSVSCSAPAGLSVCSVDLAVGEVSAAVVRGGTTVASVVSPYAVSSTPTVQDLQYVAVSSLRSGRTVPVPETATPSSAPVATASAPMPSPTGSSPAGGSVPTQPAATAPAVPAATPVATGTPAPSSAPAPLDGSAITVAVSITLAPVQPVAGEARILVAVGPAAEGVVMLWVDGRAAASSAMSAGQAVGLSTGPLSPGPHLVSASFTPADMSRFRGRSSDAWVVTAGP